MELQPDIPLDARSIARCINDPDEMHLVWPKARWPFDHEQWRRALDPSSGHHPFLILEQNHVIGHAALRATDISTLFSVNYLLMVPMDGNWN